MVAAGAAAVGFGEVWHRRNQPRQHEFTYRVNHIWIDPDHPEELFDRHRLWSHRHASPIRFKRGDYLDGTSQPIGGAIRAQLADVLGYRPQGPIRMLTQPRTWGWVFNPITIYLCWPDPSSSQESAEPIGAVLEVTNTPWKERLRYPMALAKTGPTLSAEFDKELHVSPFLDQNFVYRFSVGAGTGPGQLDVAIDVHRPAGETSDPAPVVETRLQLELLAPESKTMTAALYRNFLPTHRVSLGIHLQAARLFAKRVPFVSHPRKAHD